jgi:hypothetical protein
MNPQDIDAKRKELSEITGQLTELSKLDAKDIKFTVVADLKTRADRLSEELQSAFKTILGS